MSWNGPAQLDLRRAQGRFLESGVLDPTVRSVVGASWRRSVEAGVDAEHGFAPVTMDPSDLAQYRREHRLSRVFPLLYDVLGRIADDCGCVMALGDERGQLLWVCGQSAVLRKAESIHFAEGTLWDERSAGTNAPGTALRLDAPVVITAAEHFNRSVQHWSCAAAPIHDPVSRDILGVLDITGGRDVASPQTLGMVRAAARMAEIELARLVAVEAGARLAGPRSPRAPSRPGTTPPPHLPALIDVETLGRPDCSISLRGRVIRLSPRHSEILTVLMQWPDGLSGEQLEAQIYPTQVHPSTMRSETTRLRALLGSDVLRSRPYQLTRPARGDWQLVANHLASGLVREAAAAYRGPLLPCSDAPGVISLREGLHRQMRAAILASQVPDLMASWTSTRWGADDVQMWRRQAELLPAGSPLRGVAAAEADQLDRELGLS